MPDLGQSPARRWRVWLPVVRSLRRISCNTTDHCRNLASSYKPHPGDSLVKSLVFLLPVNMESNVAAQMTCTLICY